MVVEELSGEDRPMRVDRRVGCGGRKRTRYDASEGGAA
jgi:hypothetical protein